MKTTLLMLGVCLTSTTKHLEAKKLPKTNNNCDDLIDFKLYNSAFCNGTNSPTYKLQMKQGVCYDLTDFEGLTSSLKGKECVILYDGFGCTGQQLELSEDESCRLYLGICSEPFNLKTNSLRLCPRDECSTTTTTTTTTETPKATTTPSCSDSIDFKLYADSYYDGTIHEIQMKQNVCYDLTDFNDEVSSLQGNDCVILYEDYKCTGQQLQLSKDDQCRDYLLQCSVDFNDKTSSVQLCPREECTTEIPFTTTTTPSTTTGPFNWDFNNGSVDPYYQTPAPKKESWFDWMFG